MWPFKKTTPIQAKPTKPFETVICIPGIWNNREEFLLSIVDHTDGEYIYAGYVMMNIAQKKHYAISFQENDARMQLSFRYAGKATGVSDDFLDDIADHKLVVYISSLTGSIDAARDIAFAADAVLKSGGIGIKIETAGKAFERETWEQLLNNADEGNLYKMFVLDTLADSNGTVYSCGMHNLGYKDTIVSGLAFQEAATLVSIFNYYQVIDKASIEQNQTFSISVDAPIHRITNEINQPYKGDELFENPFGMWRLSPAT